MKLKDFTNSMTLILLGFSDFLQHYYFTKVLIIENYGFLLIIYSSKFYSSESATIFQNCEKLRKIAKLRKKFFNFNNLYKYYIYDVNSLYRLFGHLVENTGQLNKASITKKNFRKDVYFSRNRRQTHEIVKRQPKFVRKPEITAANPNPPKFN